MEMNFRLIGDEVWSEHIHWKLHSFESVSLIYDLMTGMLVDEYKNLLRNGEAKIIQNELADVYKRQANMEVCVVKPTSVDDSREITETLLAGRTVILNLEGMELEIAQRIIDFISGATFAISGNLQKISNYIFLVTPTNVDISGDLQDLLGGSMETANVRGRY